MHLGGDKEDRFPPASSENTSAAQIEKDEGKHKDLQMRVWDD